MKKLRVINFGDIFRYAEEKYGIGWNPCNDVFFGNSLEYGGHTEVYPGDWQEYVSFDEPMLRSKASNYNALEVKAMTDCDKSYVILSAYFEYKGITDDAVLVDCT